MKPWKKNYIKESKKMRVRKTLIRGIRIFNLRVELNWKNSFNKIKKNQKNKGQAEKNKTIKNLIKEWKNWLNKLTP
jgi:hypothetical protein